ncbi:CbbQ/NirQ/NorQ C-terminal domain-containing protein [Fibrobacter sp.]|uniref:CbbQ/NirQ/NorQ domain-containing protein n=1 Tax=Fibrobacter sp. TaxID=35828 RepID=UPI0038904C33
MARNAHALRLLRELRLDFTQHLRLLIHFARLVDDIFHRARANGHAIASSAAGKRQIHLEILATGNSHVG